MVSGITPVARVPPFTADRIKMLVSFAPSRGKCQSPFDELARVPFFGGNPDHQIGRNEIAGKTRSSLSPLYFGRERWIISSRIVRSARVPRAIAHHSRYVQRWNPRSLIVPIVASVSRIEDTGIFGTCYDSDRAACGGFAISLHSRLIVESVYLYLHRYSTNYGSSFYWTSLSDLYAISVACECKIIG